MLDRLFGRRTAAATDTQRTAELAGALEAARRAPQRRQFHAAAVDRLTAGWLASVQAIDDDLRTSLDRLRQRSRDLFKNNEYAAKFGRLVRNNVVGAQGFILQSRVTDPGGAQDRSANQAIEAAWWRWMRPGNCEVSGRLSFRDVCNALVLGNARDGELLLRKVRTPQGLRLQVLDTARLDTTLNMDPAANGNAIVMGVEVDRFRRPVAYHLLTSLQPSTLKRREHARVPAREIIHQFIPMESEQTRGVPWLHAAMRRMKDLDGYREAAVIAARAGACKMGFYTSPDGQPVGADDQDEQGNFISQAKPGEFGVLPPGYSFEKYDPTYPHDQFDAFTKAALRGIASGIGVAYHALASDLEGVNFSSIRAGVLEEREEWMAIQQWFVDGVLVPIYEDWLLDELNAGRITLPNGSPLPVAKYDKFREHVWQPRRWSWVDPLKDMTAAVLGIQNGLTSPQRVAAQAGLDIEDVYDDLAAAKALAEAKGLTFAPGSPLSADEIERALASDD